MEKRHRRSVGDEHEPRAEKDVVTQTTGEVCPTQSGRQKSDAGRALPGLRLRPQICHQIAGRILARSQRSSSSRSGAQIRVHSAHSAADVDGLRTTLWKAPGGHPAAMVALLRTAFWEAEF